VLQGAELTTLLAHFLFLALGCIQQPDLPRVRGVEAITKYSAEIVLQDLPVIFPDDQPISDGAVECYISAMESTGLFKDIKVELTPTEDGKSCQAANTTALVLYGRILTATGQSQVAACRASSPTVLPTTPRSTD